MPASGEVRTFDTGATRDGDEGKLDFEACLSPLVIWEFAKYMESKTHLPDGTVRTADNWQKGFPLESYMKSMFRHMMDVWMIHRGHEVTRPETGEPVELEEALAGLMFNVQGYWHEVLAGNQDPRIDWADSDDFDWDAICEPEYDAEVELAREEDRLNAELDCSDFLTRMDAIAAEAHAGQTRKFSGEPYIEHPRRLARAVEGDEAKAVALLHDVIEDTDLTEDILFVKGVPASVVASVHMLTRREGRPYFDYINDICRNGSDTSLVVKRADLIDNMLDLPIDSSQYRKYQTALSMINSEIEDRRKWQERQDLRAAA